MDRRTFLTAAGTGAAALSLGALTAPQAVAAPAGPADEAQLLAWFRDTYRSIEAMTTGFGLTAD
ncbi:twin-arginine translocation signal domain-containing protein, partial [Streptomyces sp. NPDC024062]